MNNSLIGDVFKLNKWEVKGVEGLTGNVVAIDSSTKLLGQLVYLFYYLFIYYVLIISFKRIVHQRETHPQHLFGLVVNKYVLFND